MGLKLNTESFIEKANIVHGGVYEFLGDYWHGNPSKYNPNDIHPHRKTTFKSLYKDTFELFDRIKEKGYRIKYIWESDWNAWNKQGNIPIKEY